MSGHYRCYQLISIVDIFHQITFCYLTFQCNQYIVFFQGQVDGRGRPRPAREAGHVQLLAAPPRQEGLQERRRFRGEGAVPLLPRLGPQLRVELDDRGEPVDEQQARIHSKVTRSSCLLPSVVFISH